MTISADISGLFEDEIPSVDGAMEPLTIRDLATLRVHTSKITHKVCSFLEEGNTETRDSSDGFVIIVKHTEKNIGSSAYVDTVDTMGSLVAVVESESIDERSHGPFNENYGKKGTFTSTKMESDMNVALSSMEPGTENMLPDEYVQLGSTGFDY